MMRSALVQRGEAGPLRKPPTDPCSPFALNIGGGCRSLPQIGTYHAEHCSYCPANASSAWLLAETMQLSPKPRCDICMESPRSIDVIGGQRESPKPSWEQLSTLVSERSGTVLVEGHSLQMMEGLAVSSPL